MHIALCLCGFRVIYLFRKIWTLSTGAGNRRLGTQYLLVWWLSLIDSCPMILDGRPLGLANASTYLIELALEYSSKATCYKLSPQPVVVKVFRSRT